MFLHFIYFQTICLIANTLEVCVSIAIAAGCCNEGILLYWQRGSMVLLMEKSICPVLPLNATGLPSTYTLSRYLKA